MKPLKTQGIKTGLTLLSLTLFMSSAYGSNDITKWVEKITENIPPSMENWLGLFGFVLLGFISVKIVRNYLTDILLSFIQKHSIVLTELNKQKLLFPLSFVVFFGIIITGIGVLDFSEKTESILLRGSYVAFTLGIVTFFFHIVDVISLYM
ncbi:MAG: hypothetical protein VXY34_03725 [Bdellovibrionota bacterium]|nr:hypothetical protein [Bdellovibrionota bacterium]